jgi:general stress protein 26
MAHTSSSTNSAGREDLRKLAELIRDCRVAMLVTLSDEGLAASGASGHTHPGLHARPMYTQALDPERFDGELLFLTDADCQKVREIAADKHVLLTYSGSGNRYVAVTGTARVERDVEKIRELWGVHAQGWWPKGPEDPSVTLVRVRALGAEYWEGPSTARYMLSLAKAVITKTRIDADSTHAEMRIE